MFGYILLKNLRYRWLTVLLNGGLVAVCCGTVLVVLLLRREIETQTTRAAGQVHLVVAAKGSPLQIVLSSVFFLDDPTGNLALDTLKTLLRNPLVDQAVPISMGDRYGSYRIVGTSHSFVEWLGGRLAEGRIWHSEMEAVAGANVPLGVGDVFSGSHGQDSPHKESYRVCGKLAVSGTVLDNLILTDTSSYWHLHHSDKKEVTAFWVRYKGSRAAMILPRLFGGLPSVMAASPIAELSKLVGAFAQVLALAYWLAAMLMAGAGLAIFVSMLNVLKYENSSYAALRLSGLSRGFVSGLVMCEASVTAALGFLAGAVVARVIFALAFLGQVGLWPAQTLWMPLPNECKLGLFALATAAMAAWLPARRMYNIPLAKIFG